jgi:hypothetical protein
MTLYSRLVALYPDEGRLRRVAGVVGRLSSLLADIAVEWANCLYSHRSFHGRARPNAGVVRPPNMSKQEWFYRR